MKAQMSLAQQWEEEQEQEKLRQQAERERLQKEEEERRRLEAERLASEALRAQQMRERRLEAMGGGPSGVQDDNSSLSELDSSDELNVGEEQVLDSLICTFEKVVRNKNKWKLSLKDGVLTVNGKDYMFQRANGEGEW